MVLLFFLFFLFVIARCYEILFYCTSSTFTVINYIFCVVFINFVNLLFQKYVKEKMLT